MTNKQLHKVNSKVVIKLSNISNEKYTYFQGVKA